MKRKTGLCVIPYIALVCAVAIGMPVLAGVAGTTMSVGQADASADPADEPRPASSMRDAAALASDPVQDAEPLPMTEGIDIESRPAARPPEMTIETAPGPGQIEEFEMMPMGEGVDIEPKLAPRPAEAATPGSEVPLQQSIPAPAPAAPPR